MLALALRYGLTDMLQTITPAQALWIIMAGCLLMLCNLLGAARWHLALAGARGRHGLLTLLALYWEGSLVAQVVPSPLSDAVRVVLARRRGIDLTMAAKAAILDRAALLVVLGAAAMVATLSLPPARHAHLLQTLSAALCLASTAAFIAVTQTNLLARFAGMARRVNLTFGGAQDLAIARTSCFWIVAAAGGTMVLLLVAGGIIGAALDLPLSGGDYLVVVPVAILATVIPISVSGWGVREGALVAVMGGLGVAANHALAFSVLFGLALGLSSLPGCLPLILGRTASNPGEAIAAKTPAHVNSPG